MKCPECGRENPDDAVVCSECGWVLVWVRADGPNLRTSRLAIASAVLGILSIPCFSSQIKTDSLDFPSACLIGFASWITGVSAVSLGVAALACIELDRGRLKGRLYALIGILIPLVCFLLVVVAAALT